jgi:hypothetical protein
MENSKEASPTRNQRKEKREKSAGEIASEDNPQQVEVQRWDSSRNY